MNEKDILSAVDHLATDVRSKLRHFRATPCKSCKTQSFKPSIQFSPGVTWLTMWDSNSCAEVKNLEAAEAVPSLHDGGSRILRWLSPNWRRPVCKPLGQDNEAEEYSRKAVELNENTSNQEKYLIQLRAATRF